MTGPHTSPRASFAAAAPRADMVHALAVFGARGSYSEEAGMAFARRAGLRVRLENLPTVEGVLEALSRGVVDLGVLPIFNSTAGLVGPSLEAMGRRVFRPVGEVTVEVSHCLIVSSSAVRLCDVRRVASHPQALRQCNEYLERVLPDRETLEWNDTASAARDLASGVLGGETAIIASRRAARLRNLEVLKEGIQNSPDNRTTFVVVSGREP